MRPKYSPTPSRNENLGLLINYIPRQLKPGERSRGLCPRNVGSRKFRRVSSSPQCWANAAEQMARWREIAKISAYYARERKQVLGADVGAQRNEFAGTTMPSWSR